MQVEAQAKEIERLEAKLALYAAVVPEIKIKGPGKDFSITKTETEDE